MAKQIFNEKGETNTRGAARYMDIGEQATGKLIREGKIEAYKDPETGSWRTTQAALDKYMANKGQRSQNGTRKYFVYLDAEKLAQVKALGLDPEVAFSREKREAMAQRRAQREAEAVAGAGIVVE